MGIALSTVVHAWKDTDGQGKAPADSLHSNADWSGVLQYLSLLTRWSGGVHVFVQAQRVGGQQLQYSLSPRYSLETGTEPGTKLVASKPIKPPVSKDLGH